jgi:hypothetical protein
MASFDSGDLGGCFLGKLRAKETQGSKHRLFDFFDDAGNLVASTAMSRGWTARTAIGPPMVSKIQRDLKLQGHAKDFHDLIRCPLAREAWLRLLGAVVLP